MTRNTRKGLLAMLLALCFSLCACAGNPSQDKLYAKLISRFTDAGCSVTLAPVPQGQPVGIADASRWQQLLVDGEAVLVYFDESNRADYLQTFVDAEAFGLVTRFGQRFVLTYAGENQRVLAVLEQLTP